MDAEKDGRMFREKWTDGVLQYAQLLLSANGSSPQSDPSVVQRHLLRREGVFEPAAVDRIGKTLGGNK